MQNYSFICFIFFIIFFSGCSAQTDLNIEENKTIWNSFYKPEHIKKAAQCSKCTLYYWDIERKLSVQNIISSDIFYQTFDTKGGGGKMICRLCDPKAFTNKKQ